MQKFQEHLQWLLLQIFALSPNVMIFERKIYLSHENEFNIDQQSVKNSQDLQNKTDIEMDMEMEVSPFSGTIREHNYCLNKLYERSYF